MSTLRTTADIPLGGKQHAPEFLISPWAWAVASLLSYRQSLVMRLSPQDENPKKEVAGTKATQSPRPPLPQPSLTSERCKRVLTRAGPPTGSAYPAPRAPCSHQGDSESPRLVPGLCQALAWLQHLTRLLSTAKEV